MKTDVFTEDELRYMYGMVNPHGFLTVWQAMYAAKCHAGPWTISRRPMVFGALERENRMPGVGQTYFEPNIIGWHITIPIGFGTLALWGYWRCAQ